MPVELARLEAIFSEALRQPTHAERADFVDRACGDDAELRERIDRLLACHDTAGTFLAPPEAATLSLTPSIREKPGSQIGRYKLLEQIGEGGFGVVFMAEQEHPVRRRVALKIVKLGMDTRQVIARFEAERQALAMMDHPNIARVLDGGATETGRPYFVMELVKGIPITEYCDRHKLKITQRLELFMQVCQAVQHAHQKGLIHRDIKPSNILVNTQDDRPVAKIIDFGIAKATQARLTEKTLFTEFRQLVGTPQYMSPEQTDGNLDVDTRADIYSLGVLLYELLTGTTPFDPRELRSNAFAEMQRIIREVEPPRPSTRLSAMKETLPSIAAHRAIEPRKLDTLVRGELDWIVMKCLEKDRARRYETANGLAMDVGRYLANDPVLACPPSARYRLGKLVSRHRKSLATAAAFAAILIAAAVVSTWLAIRATHAEKAAVVDRDRADQARQQAQEVSNYLISALSSPAPWRDGRTITIAEVLDRDVKELQDKFADNPGTKAALLEAIGQSYMGLGLYRDAIPLMESVRSLRIGALGPDHPDTLNSMHNLAWAYNRAGRVDDAVPLGEATLKLRKAKLGPDHPDTLRSMHNLALHYWGTNRLNDVVLLLEETFKLSKLKLGTDHHDTLLVMNDLGAALRDSGRTEEALLLAEQTVKLMTARLGPEKDTTTWSKNNLAEVYRKTGRLQEAVTLGQENVKLSVARLGPEHPVTLILMHSLGNSYQSAGRTQEAIALLEGTLRVKTVKLGQDHPETLWLMDDLVAAYRSAGRLDDAVPLQERLVRLRTTKLGPDHSNTRWSMQTLAATTQQQQHERQSRQLAADFALMREAVQRQDWNTAVAECARLLDLLPHERSWNCPRKALCLEIAASGELFNRLVTLRPSDVDLWIGRGRHFVILQDWKQAIAQYERVRSSLPPNSEQGEYASLLVLLGDQAGYERFVSELKSQETAARLIVTLVAPQSIVPAEAYVQWALDMSRNSEPRPPTAYLQALAYYRAGQFDKALEAGRSLSNLNWPAAAWSQNWLVMAMAHQRLGDSQEAQRCMAEARKLHDPFGSPDKYDPERHPLPGLLGVAVLLREAQTLLQQPAPTTRP